MIRHYTFNYNMFDAEASFKVDTDIFTAEIAKLTLDFFDWSYSKKADPIDEAMKKYARKAIIIATENDYNVYGVTREFENIEGYGKVDGSEGIHLMTVTGWEFDDELLDMTIVNDKP